MTIGQCDAVIARGDAGEVYVNSILATVDRCWITLHFDVKSDDYDAFGDLQTWREESLAQFRPDEPGMYDLTLTIDSRLAEFDFGRGNGGGVDDETRWLHWTQCLTFQRQPSEHLATFTLRWDEVGLSGVYNLDLDHVARSVERSAY